MDDSSFFQGKLPAVLRIYRDTLASDIKTSVKVTVLNMHLESDSISGEGIGDTDGGFNASFQNYRFSGLHKYLLSAERLLSF